MIMLPSVTFDIRASNIARRVCALCLIFCPTFSLAGLVTYPSTDKITIASSIEGMITSMAFGDLNGDGNLDVVLGKSDGAIYWVPSQGSGLFRAPQLLIKNKDSILQDDGSSSTYYAEKIFAIDIADMNGDGNLDIVAGCQMSFYADVAILLLVNNGNGSFTARMILRSQAPIEGPTTFIENLSAYDLKVADFKGNGVNDIIATVYSYTGVLDGTGMLLYLENTIVDGSAVFTTRVLSDEIGILAALAPADFNEDGRIDVAVLSRGRGLLWIFENHVDGTFVTHVIDVSAISNYDIGVGDLEGDGDIDIACVGERTLSVYWNQGDWSFQEELVYDCREDPKTTKCEGRSLAVFDADNDGLSDIIAVPYLGNNYVETWFRQTEPGTFAMPEPFVNEVELALPAFVDVNGDDIADFVVTNAINVFCFLGREGPDEEENNWCTWVLQCSEGPAEEENNWCTWVFQCSP